MKNIKIKNCENKDYNGLYTLTNNKCYKKNDDHYLYKYNGIWRLGNKGVKYYKILEECKNKNWNIEEYDMNDNYPEIIKNIKNDNISLLKIDSLINIKNAVLKTNHLPGVIIEFGCAKGGSSLVMTKYKNKQTKLYLFDIFDMIPPPSEIDGNKATERYSIIKNKKEKKDYYGYIPKLQDKIIETYDKYNLNCGENAVYFVKGLYEKTLPENISLFSNKISFAHIDCDWYSSVKICLTHIVPNLLIDGIIIIDDYNFWEGTNKAVDEYFIDIKHQFNFYFINKKLHVKKII